MAQGSRLAATFLACTLAACGGKAVGMSNPDVGGSTQGGSASVAGSASGGSASSVCAGYVDDAGTSVNVDIVNSTSAALFLGEKRFDCSTWAPFSVKDENGVALAPLSGCRSPCDVVAESGDLACPDICVAPFAIFLSPGATYHTSWSGLYADALRMPKECLSPRGSSECERASIIQPGRFTFAARAASAIDCTQTGGGSCASCPAGVDVCNISGALISGELRNTSTSALLDAEYGVFPSSRPQRAPADPSPPTRSVELVFKD
jgi:hypothetical protein